MSAAPMHHPAEETLLLHAAGRLSAARSLVIATHLPFCRDCQSAVRGAEAVGGALLSAMPASTMRPEALDRTLAHLDVPPVRFEPLAEPVALAQGVVLPENLRGLVKPKWRWLAPGISRMAVDLAPGPVGAPRENICLLRVGPGKYLPDHGHRGWEATCVLSGRFTDSTGEYGPGDVAEMDGVGMDGTGMDATGTNRADAGATHQPVAGTGEDCICLIAWEGKLRMRGLLARLLQPLMGV